MRNKIQAQVVNFAKLNLVRIYSSSGPDMARGSSSYQYKHKTPFGVYYFNAVDTNPSPGPRRPFNFFGHMDEVSRSNVESV